MNSGRSVTLIATPVFLSGFLVGVLAGSLVNGAGGPTRKVGEVLNLVDQKYYRESDSELKVEAAIKGIARSLDPYSEYFSAQEWTDFASEHLEGEFGGVGIRVEPEPQTGTVRIISPIDNSPAIKAGLRSGDRISAVDGKPLKDLPYEKIIGMIRGKKGTSVRLTILRADQEPFDVTLLRDTIKLKKVLQTRIEREGKPSVAYVRLTEFTDGVTDAVAKVLRELKAGAVIVDVRQNPGGLLEECVELSGLFVGKKKIVVTRTRNSAEERLSKRDALPELAGVPVVVLADEGSASASEIFAGALQDYGAAVVIGRKTYGKGTVQESHQLKDGSHFKLTVAIYELPKGRSGADPKYAVEPDHMVEIMPEQAKARAEWWGALHGGQAETPHPADDPQMKKALEVLDARSGD